MASVTVQVRVELSPLVIEVGLAEKDKLGKLDGVHTLPFHVNPPSHVALNDALSRNMLPVTPYRSRTYADEEYGKI